MIHPLVLFLVAWITVTGLIVYAAVHFVTKFW